jgi:hypothetical protein
MITQEITSEKMTEDQERQLKRFYDEVLHELGFSKSEAQEVIEKPGKLKAGIKDHMSKLSIADKRFELVKTFDITVPENYKHGVRLDSFRKEHKKEFYYYNEAITDKNFENATTKLEPGRKLKVKVFNIKETVTSTDCMEFLKSQKAILLGAAGASLCYELAKEQFPLNSWNISFDEKDALWTDSDGCHGVPGLGHVSDGDWKFGLGYFERAWDSDYSLLCFCD